MDIIIEKLFAVRSNNIETYAKFIKICQIIGWELLEQDFEKISLSFYNSVIFENKDGKLIMRVGDSNENELIFKLDNKTEYKDALRAALDTHEEWEDGIKQQESESKYFTDWLNEHTDKEPSKKLKVKVKVDWNVDQLKVILQELKDSGIDSSLNAEIAQRQIAIITDLELNKIELKEEILELNRFNESLVFQNNYLVDIISDMYNESNNHISSANCPKQIIKQKK